MDNISVSNKTVERCYFKTPFGEFEVYAVMQLLEELEGTAYGFSHLVIYDPDLGKWLESLGVCSKNVRGSYCRGENYQEVYDSLFELVYTET